MTIRSDISIDWGASPRIIEVAAPSTELTIQDLYDTLRTLSVEQMDEPEIIEGSGKEILGVGVLVGLTVTLLNARVKFEDRAGPGWVACSIGGGNLVAVDEAGDPISPVEPSAYTQVQVVMSAAGTITITGSGVTEQDKVDIATKVEVKLEPIKAKTDNLPTDPAEESSVQDLQDKIGVPTSTVAGDIGEIEVKVAALPDDPADQSLLQAALDEIKAKMGTQGAHFRG